MAGKYSRPPLEVTKVFFCAPEALQAIFGVPETLVRGVGFQVVFGTVLGFEIGARQAPGTLKIQLYA